MILYPRKCIIFLMGFGCCVGLVACSALRVLKASEAPDYGFLPRPELLSEMFGRRPFNKSWVQPDSGKYAELKHRYHNLYINPINTSILESAIAQKYSGDAETRVDRTEEAQELARYFYHKLALAIKQYQGHPLKVVASSPGDGFVLKIALVELQPTSPAINVVGTAAGVFVPGGGLIKIVAKGEVAMEGYLQDGRSGELLEQFKDRETDKAAPFTVKDFQRYAHVRASIDDWAMQLAEIMAKLLDEAISDSLPFSVNPF